MRVIEDLVAKLRIAEEQQDSLKQAVKARDDEIDRTF